MNVLFEFTDKIQSARMLLCPEYGYDIIEVRQVDYTFKVKKLLTL